MSEHQWPTHKTAKDRGEGHEAEASWTRIGSGSPYKGGKRYNIALSAPPVSAVLREFPDYDAKAEEAKPANKVSNRR
jgi:hypothetical protein